MQLVALKYFVAVADHGSFTAAAERLGVSASTLTRSVSTLEDNLGLTLFERSLRGVALAPGAAPVLAETKRMLASLEAVTEAAGGAARGIAGDLRLGVRSPPLGEPLRGMLGRYHALASRDVLKWTDFHGETIYVQDWAQSHAMREFYASMMGAGMPLHPMSASKQTVFSLVATGFGVTLAQQSQAEASFPGVAFKKIEETNAWVEFSLAWSPQSEYAVIGRFLASMRASAADKGVGASAS